MNKSDKIHLLTVAVFTSICIGGYFLGIIFANKYNKKVQIEIEQIVQQKFEEQNKLMINFIEQQTEKIKDVFTNGEIVLEEIVE